MAERVIPPTDRAEAIASFARLVERSGIPDA